MSAAPTNAGPVVRIGTRASTLARTQSALIAEALTKATGRRTELVLIRTEGDISSKPLATIGGTGVFVSALRDALLRGEIDLAVHSLKDLPTAPADGIALAAVPTREDPRDVVVARDGLTLGELPAGARVGTGAPRRASQIAALGLGVEVVGVRGNVDTRLDKVASGEDRRGRARPRRPGPAGPGGRGDRGARPAADAACPGSGSPRRGVPGRRRAARPGAPGPRRPGHPSLCHGRANAARGARGGVLGPGRRPGRSCGR